MVALGVLSVLGSAPAAAQEDNTAPEMDSATYEPGTAVITVTMTEDVWGDNVPAGVFTIQGDTDNEAVIHTISTTEGRADDEFMVTFEEKFETGANPTLVYALLTSGSVAGYIVDEAGNRMSGDNESATEEDTPPKLPDVADMTFAVGEDVDEDLDEATGGNRRARLRAHRSSRRAQQF